MEDLVPQQTIDEVAQHINFRNSKQYGIPIVSVPSNPESPHYFEIVPFTEIDQKEWRVYAVDGSQANKAFYNGLAIGVYRGGYVCFEGGVQRRVNDNDDPVVFGKTYLPQNMLITNEDHLYAMIKELLVLPPVKAFLSFLNAPLKDIFPYTADALVAGSISKVLSFCQEILEWSLVYEIALRDDIRPGDLILRDGTLRTLNIKQEHLVKLGELLASKGIIVLAVTKNSPIKMELNYTFRQIDNYLQEQLKPQYPFKQTDPRYQKLCCWFEVPEVVLAAAYGRTGSQYARKALTGGRGFGLFFAARLDYVEKLQNYDWVLVDINFFDAVPSALTGDLTRDTERLFSIFHELTRLTQEHYILGYPYPLVEAHNLVSLTSAFFEEEIVNRVKHSMYQNQLMDNVDIENLFLDIHSRF